MLHTKFSWIKKSEPEPVVSLPRKVCPLCTRSYTDDSLFCKFDGQKLQLDDQPKADPGFSQECPSCGFVLRSKKPRCPVCGHPFSVNSQGSGAAFFNLIPVSGIPLKIDSFPYILGRKDVLRHHFSEYVSSEQIIFYRESGKFYVKERKSLNGSTLNGHVIGGKNLESMKKLPLADGDEIGMVLDRNLTPLIRFQVEIPSDQFGDISKALAKRGGIS